MQRPVVFTLVFAVTACTFAVEATAQTGSAKAPMTQEKPSTTQQPHKPSQQSSGNTSPNITQGPGSIVQIGNNNSALIVNHPPTGWGMLSDEALAVLSNTMKSYPSQRLHIKISNMDTNRQQMAMQIIRAARAAGWTATIENYMAWYDPEKELPTGMQLHVRNVTPAAEHLGGALAQLYGIQNMHTGHKDENFEPGLIELNIWPRKP